MARFILLGGYLPCPSGFAILDNKCNKGKRCARLPAKSPLGGLIFGHEVLQWLYFPAVMTLVARCVAGVAVIASNAKH